MKKRLTFLMAALMLLTILTNPLTGWSQAKTTYHLVQVTSVSAGELYVFEQDGYVMNNTVSSNALQTTNTYNTTGLTGTESYVWTLEASNSNFKMKNPSINGDNKYLAKGSGNTDLTFNSTGAAWSFTFQQDNTVLIQNTNASNRFLGYTTSNSHVYKGYATSNLNSYPHAVVVYHLEEESTTATVTIDSPMNLPATATDNGTINVTKSNITPNSDSSIEFYDNSECTGSTITPDWFSASFATIAKGTDYDHITYSAYANNTGSARTPIYMKVTLTDGTNSPYAVVEINQYPYYTVTFNGHGGTYNSNPTYTQSIPGGVATNLTTNQFVNPNYAFTRWTTNENGSGEVYTNDQSVTLTSPLANLYAQWAQLYTITIDDDITNGTVTADVESALAGATVTLTITPDEGYILDELQYIVGEDATDITGNTFDMPANNVTITATFILAEIYERHTGTLTEGDYVIISSTTALKNATKSNGLDYITNISINEDDQIINPDETIVWHIAPSGTDGYWTIYNAKAKQYAASTGAKNKATLSNDGTDDKSLWSYSGTETYEIINLQNTTNSVNANLRYNSGNYWACYSTSTGTSLKLYKLSEPERTLTSITISGQTTDYIVDETFSFDGECVAHYDNGSSKTVTPTSVTSPDMSSTGSETITVTYTESGVSKTTSYTITVITNPYSTTSLTGLDMSNMSNAGTTYNNLKSVTTGGFTWVSNGFQDQNITNMIQIRARNNGAGVSYVKLPDVNGALKRITLTVTSAGADTPSGDGTPNVLYFQKSNTSTEDPITQGGGTTTNSIVLDLRQSFCTSGYITASGALRIWNIELEYLPYENNGSTAISDIPIQTAVAVTNSAATASTLTIPKSSSLCIKSGAKLTMSGTLTNEGNENNLIIEDGGQLILKNGNSGVEATVKKTTAASAKVISAWNAISSSVDNVEISTFIQDESDEQNEHNVYQYDEATVVWQEYRNTSNPFPNLTNGRGYLYRSLISGVEFAGDVIAGDKDGYVDCSGFLSWSCNDYNGRYKGFNLIGNPFTHDITWSNIIDINEKISDAGYYTLKSNGNWNPQTTDGTIAPMQAFLIQATGSSPALKIANVAPVKGDDDKFGGDQIVFNVENSEYSDVAYVLFKKGHGLNKIEHRNDLIPMIYIINEDGDYAIADMPDNTSVINLGFEAKTMGQYKLSLKAEGWYSYMHLVDKLTGEDVDMLIEDDYTFIGSPSDRKDRFVLHLKYNAAGIDTDSDIFAYQNGSDILVSGESELQIFDVMGRLVMNQRINGVETVNGLEHGVYIFKLEGKTQKIVVR